VETFLVRLWAEPEPAGPPLAAEHLHGIVESPGHHHPTRPFVGGEQLVSQLEAALAERLREKRAVSRAHHPATGGDDDEDDDDDDNQGTNLPPGV
jgi:hypothetical protein